MTPAIKAGLDIVGNNGAGNTIELTQEIEGQLSLEANAGCTLTDSMQIKVVEPEGPTGTAWPTHRSTPTTNE